MYATLHTLTGVPGPLDEGWARELAATVRDCGPAAGVVVGRRFAVGEGTLLALWPTAADADRAVAALERHAPASSGRGPCLAPGGRYEVTAHRAASAPRGAARYLQVTTFPGPRDDAWVAAVKRADEERVWPAVRDVPGVAGGLALQAADGGRVVIALGETVETFDEVVRRIMTTQLLPWEDPGLLTGPDDVDVQRLLVADLPAEVTR